MSRVSKCDRCGDVFDPQTVDNCVKIRLESGREILGKIIRDTPRAGDIMIDVCPACYSGFKAWFEMTYDKEEEQNAKRRVS